VRRTIGTKGAAASGIVEADRGKGTKGAAIVAGKDKRLSYTSQELPAIQRCLFGKQGRAVVAQSKPTI